MRSKGVIAGRRVGGTYTLPEHREAYADDFGAENDTLTPGNNVSLRKILNGLTNSEVRPVCQQSADSVESIACDSIDIPH
jgi:hypothetical protein